MGGDTAHDPGRPALVFGLAILTALTLRAVFHLAFRQTEGLIGCIVGLLGLATRVPDHTTLSRRAATLERPRSGSGGAGSDAEPLHLLVDSTGLKLYGAGCQRRMKSGWPENAMRRSWRGWVADHGCDQAVALGRR